MIKGKRNIVWIASYPKSGNTWLRVFLSNFMSEYETPININDMDISGIASSRVLFDQLSAVNSSNLTHTEIERLRPHVYRQLSIQSDDTIYMKVHDAWSLNDRGEPLFPDDVTQSVIYIIRHPLDVAVSLSFHNSSEIKQALKKLNDESYGLCIRPKKLFNQLPQKLLSWSDHVNSWTLQSGLKIHVMKYEQMQDNPELAFSRVLDFLNLTYTGDTLHQAIANSSFEELKKQEQVQGFHEKPLKADSFFRKGIQSDWHNHIDQHTAETFLAKNKNVLNHFYPPSS